MKLYLSAKRKETKDLFDSSSDSDDVYEVEDDVKEEEDLAAANNTNEASLSILSLAFKKSHSLKDMSVLKSES